MRRYLGITGTPGTGKKSLSPLVASRLGVPSFSLNALAESYGLVERGRRDGEVDAGRLGRRILKDVRGPCLLFGHLLPYAFGRNVFARVVVLRCEPKVLKRRLMNRGYPPRKIVENLEAELIGAIAADSREAFGRRHVAEFDTSAVTTRQAAPSLADLLSNPSAQSQPIDWLGSYDSASRLKSLLNVGREASAFT